MNELARQPTGLTPQQMAAVMADPMLAAPVELRPAIWQVWVCHQHLFPTPLPLAGAVGRWTRESGLRHDDAQAILRRALTPEAMRGFRFAADLLTFLAESAKEVTDRRKRQAEVEERRALTPTSADLVRRLTAGIGDVPADMQEDAELKRLADEPAF